MSKKPFAFSTFCEISIPPNHIYPINPKLPKLNISSPRKCLTEEDSITLYKYAFEQLKIAETASSIYKVCSHLSKSLLIFIGLNTGLRISEIRNLCWGDFVIHSACVFVRCGKGKKARYVYFRREILEPILMKAHSIVTKCLDIPNGAKDWIFYSPAKKHKPYDERSLQYSFKQILKNTGIREYLTPHCLRHTFAVNFYHASEKDIHLLKEQLGHSDIKTTQIYISTLLPSVSHATKAMYQKIIVKKGRK